MNKDLQLLSNISSLLSKIKYEDSLTDEITEVIKEHTNLSKLNIYIFDNYDIFFLFYGKIRY